MTENILCGTVCRFVNLTAHYLTSLLSRQKSRGLSKNPTEKAPHKHEVLFIDYL